VDHELRLPGFIVHDIALLANPVLLPARIFLIDPEFRSG